MGSIGELTGACQLQRMARSGTLVARSRMLIGVTLVLALWIGISNIDGAITPMQILANTDVDHLPLLWWPDRLRRFGAMLLLKRTPANQVATAAASGARSMLRLRWCCSCVDDGRRSSPRWGVGEYLAGLIGGGLAFSLLPAILFVLACFISFSSGSSVGTFG